MSGNIELKSEKEKFWQSHILAWEQSGLSQEEYCLKNKISFYAFGYWRSQFNRRLRELKRNHFVEMPSSDKYKQPSSPVIQMMLPNGVRIGISSGISVQMMREVISVVSSC